MDYSNHVSQKSFERLKLWSVNKGYEWFEIERNPRLLYDFFDQHGILITVDNDHEKGTNNWSLEVVIDKAKHYCKMGIYPNRTWAEEAAFELAMNVMHYQFDKIVKQTHQYEKAT